MNNDISRAVANRDGSALSRMAAPYPEQPKVVNSEAERLVDSLFRQLKQIFPAAVNTNLRTDADEDTAKKQWIAAFAEGGIRTRDQLSAGMQYARSSESPFWPSPGQFVSWCRLVRKSRLACRPAKSWWPCFTTTANVVDITTIPKLIRGHSTRITGWSLRCIRG